MAYASNRGMLLRMQSPIDPHEQSGLLRELVCGGIAALVAERIVERKGEPMPTAAEPHTHSSPSASGDPRQASADLQRNKSIVRRFDELIRDGDPNDLATLCTPDMVNHALAPSRPSGLEGTREFLIECRRDPRRAEWRRGIVHRDRAVVAEGDLVVQFVEVEAVWPGGTFRGIDTASGPYKTDAAFMYRLVDGRIAERWAVRDDLGMMRQLGAIR